MACKGNSWPVHCRYANNWSNGINGDVSSDYHYQASRLAASHRKQDHYGPLLQDSKGSAHFVELVTVEIGCLPFYASNCRYIVRSVP